ncbi:hypothetical protein ABTZ46_12245 [Nocardioides sp. NPDC126508]
MSTALTRRYAYCASPSLSSLTVSPTTLVSGNPATAVARLACRSTKSIRLVVATTEGAVAHNAGDIWILRDRPSATFLVTAQARTNRLNVTVKVRKAGSTRWLSDTFVATANPEMCMPSSRATSNVIYAGTKPTTVTLRQPCALDISRYVYLGSSNSHVKVPSRILVPAGKASLGVPVTVADGTSVDTPGNLIDSILTVGPYSGGWAHNFELLVHPGLESIHVTTWLADDGTRIANARVDLGLPAVTDTVVRLESSDPLLPLPSSLTVAKGDSFAQTTQTIAPPPEDAEVQITASFGSQQRTDTVLVQRNFRPGDPIALSKQTFYGGGRAGFWIEIGRPAGSDGVPVTVSSDSSLLTFEPTAFRPGQTAAGVTFDIAEVTETTPITLHVTASTHTYDVPITLQPGLAAITLPERATSDETFTGTVTLTGVSAVDTPVLLTSESSSFKVPSEVIIPAGETSATFQGVVHLSSTSSGVVTQLDAYLGRLYTSNDMIVSPAP